MSNKSSRLRELVAEIQKAAPGAVVIRRSPLLGTGRDVVWEVSSPALLDVVGLGGSREEAAEDLLNAIETFEIDYDDDDEGHGFGDAL